jgi:hypothetical protein
MLDVNEIRRPAIALSGLTGVDRALTFHYDETNNIRRLLLTPEGLNVRTPQCFVLGGVVHPGPVPSLDFEDLRRAFGLQKSSLELKLEQLGKGDFLSLLNAPRIGQFLDWLSASGAFAHYQVLDPLYWSLVDVVDSIVTEDGNVQLMMIAPLLKNDLYTVLRGDVDGTAEMLGRYRYPDVGRTQRPAFVAELRDLLDARSDLLPGFNYQMLKGLLEIAAGLDSLPYLEDESPNILIDGFGDFYLHRLALFKNATHILDIETTIQTYLAGLDLCDGAMPLRNFSFVDSRAAPWVQVSDALAGLLGKLFTYASNTPVDDIEAALASLNARQRGALDMLIGFLDRSIEECAGFAHYVVSLEDHQRRAAILGF